MPAVRLRVLPGAFLAALLLACSAAMSVDTPVAGAAGTCTVDPSATPGPGVYATVNAATNDASCSTVNVVAGTFTEQVTISHALTLTGAGQGSTTLLYPASTAPSYDNGGNVELSIQAGGVTVSNLTVDGASDDCLKQTPSNCGNSTYEFHGVAISDGGVTLNQVTVQHMGSLPSSGDNGVFAYGVFVAGSSSNGQPVTIKNSVVQSFSGPGVSVALQGSDFDFTNNTVVGNGTTGQVGIEGGTLISGNTFKHFHAPVCSSCVPGGLRPTAIVTGSGTVSNNTITDSDNGVLVEDAETTTATITGNTFSGVGTAITLAGNQAPQIAQNNHLSGVTAATGWPYYPGVGIAVCEDQHDKITSNTISGAANYGIAVYAAQTPACSSAGPGWLPTADNTISGNTVSGSGGADIFDATHGSGTTGTANNYASNTCSRGQPVALCASGAGGSTTAQPTAGAKGTPSSQGTATGAATTPTAARGGPSTAPTRTGGGSTGLLLLLGLGGLVVLGGGGGAAYYFAKRSRMSKQLAARQHAYPPQWDQPWDDNPYRGVSPWQTTRRDENLW